VIWVSVFLFLIGIAGCFVNFLPGITLVFAGIFFYGFFEGFRQVTKNYILVLLLITTIVVFADTITLRKGIFLNKNIRGWIKAGISTAMFISFLFMI